MTEQKWAPGPWDVDEGDFSIHQIETSDIVAECFGPVNDLLATARLIAAAPDMYAATDWVMTEHPAIAAKCTKRQIEVFEQIAVGNTLHPQRTIEALAAKGLVLFKEHQSKDALGVFSWKEPFVPIHIHYQWCKWCADNFDCED